MTSEQVCLIHHYWFVQECKCPHHVRKIQLWMRRPSGWVSTFTSLHLTDAFIQSHFHYIVLYMCFGSMCTPWDHTHDLGLASATGSDFLIWCFIQTSVHVKRQNVTHDRIPKYMMKTWYFKNMLLYSNVMFALRHIVQKRVSWCCLNILCGCSQLCWDWVLIMCEVWEVFAGLVFIVFLVKWRAEHHFVLRSSRSPVGISCPT